MRERTFVSNYTSDFTKLTCGGCSRRALQLTFPLFLPKSGSFEVDKTEVGLLKPLLQTASICAVPAPLSSLMADEALLIDLTEGSTFFPFVYCLDPSSIKTVRSTTIYTMLHINFTTAAEMIPAQTFKTQFQTFVFFASLVTYFELSLSHNFHFIFTSLHTVQYFTLNILRLNINRARGKLRVLCLHTCIFLAPSGWCSE